MDSPFFCDMNALTDEERGRHHQLAFQLRPAVLAFEELPNGYAAQFLREETIMQAVTQFVWLESKCCPFFTLALELAEDNPYLWLKVTGREGIKPFIRAEFSIPETIEIADE